MHLQRICVLEKKIQKPIYAENMYNIKYNPKVIPCQTLSYYRVILPQCSPSPQCVPKDTTLQLVMGGNEWVMGISILTPHRFCRFRYGTFTMSCRGRERSLKLKKFHNGAQV
jgi:hypothetical protein